MVYDFYRFVIFIDNNFFVHKIYFNSTAKFPIIKISIALLFKDTIASFGKQTMGSSCKLKLVFIKDLYPDISQYF